MQEKGSWSHQHEGVFPSCDSESHKEVKRLASDNTRMSDKCYKSSNIDTIDSELCVDDTMLGDKCVVEDDSVCQYPINPVSQADNELSFLDNDGWLDIGNFEDIDRMFRSCDSTFGMDSLNNEDEFCWLSSAQGTEGSNDALKSTFKLSCAEESPLKCTSDNNIDSTANIDGLLFDGSNTETSFDKNFRTQMDVDDDPIPGSISMFSESDMNSGYTDNLVPAPAEKMQRKLSKTSEGRRKNEYLENKNPVNPCTPLKQYGHAKQPFGASTGKATSHVSIQKHKPNTGSDSSGCVESHINIVHPEYNHSANHASLLPTLSTSRSENNGHPTLSFKESSYASNVESSECHPFEAAAMKTNVKSEKLYHHKAAQPISRSIKNENMEGLMPFHSPGSQQLRHQFENENESHSEVEGVSVGISQETNVQEISSMSSVDEISLEACFRQLQPVMDQLDIRTKLCIRDSLYRLAKSAEQRHNYANGNGKIGDEPEACKVIMAQDASRCSGFMDMETDTNPIDRSIAHLLFHRPSDPSMLPPEK